MNWISQHHILVDCKEKVVHFFFFCKPGDKVLEFKRKQMNIGNCLISGVRTCKLMFKGCIRYMAYLLNKSSEPGKVEEVPVVNEYLDAFSAKLTPFTS
jgi:hypothetical protein